jgi:hypothetical protein
MSKSTLKARRHGPALENSRGNRALIVHTRDRGGDEPKEVAEGMGRPGTKRR